METELIDLLSIQKNRIPIDIRCFFHHLFCLRTTSASVKHIQPLKIKFYKMKRKLNLYDSLCPFVQKKNLIIIIIAINIIYKYSMLLLSLFWLLLSFACDCCDIEILLLRNYKISCDFGCSYAPNSS